jgi:glucose-6-phosphate 1-dehydrogenase
MSKPVLEPCLFVIFGATGDLMRRKLLPAIYELSADGSMPEKYAILGVSLETDIDDAKFRGLAREALRVTGAPAHEIASAWCDACLHYQPIGEGDAAGFKSLVGRIEALERNLALTGNRIFYLALPPDAFPGTITALGDAGLSHSGGWTRLVIEKPFGRDLASARELNQLAHRYFDETQIYRIDHYLGKDTVQNLLAFRFGNALFESAWNRDQIESVLISVAEDLGVEGRGAYYETAGALRDMVQNHLTQLLTLTAMEIPSAFEADAIRFEKIKVLRSMAPIAPDDVVFGQYARGREEPQGRPAYREEPHVAPDSNIETYVALRLYIDNWRWQGVPFALRTGKRMPCRLSQIIIRFRCPPVSVFRFSGTRTTYPNVLTITLQPNEGFDLTFEVKEPGQPISLRTQHMDFRYAEAFGALPDAYQTLLLDVLEGDQTLFVHAGEAEASWQLYAPLLEYRGAPPYPYAAGTWGPTEANRLFNREASSCGRDNGCAEKR